MAVQRYNHRQTSKARHDTDPNRLEQTEFLPDKPRQPSTEQEQHNIAPKDSRRRYQQCCSDLDSIPLPFTVRMQNYRQCKGVGKHPARVESRVELDGCDP